MSTTPKGVLTVRDRYGYKHAAVKLEMPVPFVKGFVNSIDRSEKGLGFTVI